MKLKLLERPVNSKNSKQAVDKIPSDEEIDLWTKEEGKKKWHIHRKAKGSLRKVLWSLPSCILSFISFIFVYPFFFPGITSVFRAEWQIIQSNFLTFWMRTWKFNEIWLTQSCHQLESKSTSERWLLAPSPVSFQQHNTASFCKTKSYNRPER